MSFDQITLLLHNRELVGADLQCRLCEFPGFFNDTLKVKTPTITVVFKGEFLKGTRFQKAKI
jgi:hypothetical protein